MDALRELKLRGQPVAAMLADYRMPQMNGIEFLEQAMDLFPRARRALLTAYADTDAAIQAINLVDVDHYLLKPWDPPEEKLYPVVDALVETWRASGDAAVEEIKVIGHRWSAPSYHARDFLARNAVPYRWFSVDEPESRRLLEAAEAEPTDIPVVITVADIENAGYVYQVSSGPETPLLPVDIKPERRHFLCSGDVRPGGMWYRVDADLHVLWYLSQRRTMQLTLDGFKGFVPSGFVSPGRKTYIALTYAPDAVDRFPDAPIPGLVAWHVAGDGVAPLDVECEPEVLGNAQLAPYWPAQHLAGMTVMVIGVGSIGGAAAHALAAYGVGHLILVDHDRLRWHNLVRHVSGAAHVGRLKVSAVREDLQLLRPETRVTACPLDVVTDADQIRALLCGTDLVVGATDGVAPRRVISHLARRARVDGILACVLLDGGPRRAVAAAALARPRLPGLPASGAPRCRRQGGGGNHS